MDRNKYLAKNTFLIFIGTFGTKFISFFMVPIYTHVLTQAQYGVTDIAFTLCMMLTPVIALNIHEAIMRFSLDQGADIRRIASSGMMILLLGSVILSPSVLVLRQVNSVRNYAVLIYCLIFTNALLYIIQSFLKGTEQIRLFTLCGITVTFLTAILNIIFLIVFRMEIYGYLLSTVLAYFLTSVIFFFTGKMYQYISLHTFDMEILRDMLHYSVALVPNSLLWWIINSSNRLFIAGSLGTAANGIFAVSNKMPTLLNNITIVFQQAWQLTAIKSKEERNKDDYSNRVLSVYSAVIWLCASGMIWLLKPVMKIYVNASYYDAWRYTPILVLAFAFLAIASYIGTYYSVAKNNVGMLISAIIGMVVNVVLNTTLIPRIGLQGASISVCFSYFAILLYRYFDTKAIVRLSLGNPVFIGSVILAVTQTVLSLMEMPYEWAWGMMFVCATVFLNWSCFSRMFHGLILLLRREKK